MFNQYKKPVADFVTDNWLIFYVLTMVYDISDLVENMDLADMVDSLDNMDCKDID